MGAFLDTGNRKLRGQKELREAKEKRKNSVMDWSGGGKAESTEGPPSGPVFSLCSLGREGACTVSFCLISPLVAQAG